MGYLVFSGFLLVVFGGGIIWWLYNRKPGRGDPNIAWGGLAGAGVVFLVWIAFSAWMSFHTVGQREVAVVYNFSGTISGKKPPGVVNTWPWQHIKKENVGILHDEWEFDTNNAAVSIDQQKITAVISVNYQVDAEKVVDLYDRVGASWKTIIIDARVPQVFKETTAKYTTPNLTARREQLRVDTKRRLTAELKPYDIKVIDVFIRNLGFSDSYTEAIERKQKQVQDALTAQAKVKQIEFEADQKVAAANGEAKSNIARARGDATANRLRQRSLTKLLIQQYAIDKLNPNVEVIVCPPATVCIPNAGVIPDPSGN